MARMARLYVPGCSQHVIQRGNNRSPCFHEAADYRRYLYYLQDAADASAVAVHAFVLMSNHVHLLLTPMDETGCGRMMQSLGRKYVHYFNNRYERSGTLWEGRYKSTLVDTDGYFYTVCRYIELNPVRANIVTEAAAYPWSSYHSHALGLPSTLLKMHPLYERLGDSPEQRRLAYQKLFDQPIPEAVLEQLREATNHAWAFGSRQFRQRLQDEANRPVESSGWGGSRRGRKRFSRGQTP